MCSGKKLAPFRDCTVDLPSKNRWYREVPCMQWKIFAQQDLWLFCQSGLSHLGRGGCDTSHTPFNFALDCVNKNSKRFAKRLFFEKFTPCFRFIVFIGGKSTGTTSERSSQDFCWVPIFTGIFPEKFRGYIALFWVKVLRTDKQSEVWQFSR